MPFAADARAIGDELIVRQVRLNLGGSVYDPTDPYGLLGLSECDAHVIRNAGGVITDDEVRSLTISQRLLGTREIILIYHTDCGIGKASDVWGDYFARSGCYPQWIWGNVSIPGREERSWTSKATSSLWVK